MASLIVGTSSMASQFLSLPSSISFSKSQILAGVSLSSPSNSSFSGISGTAFEQFVVAKAMRRPPRANDSITPSEIVTGKRSLLHAIWSFLDLQWQEKSDGLWIPQELRPILMNPFDDNEIVKIEIVE